ncbi:Fic family protein [Chitinophaga sp. sic0106]|uniref:Fic family protein n=1 Tax=Chitinophaga sp. sic0106 TaxID=2854785 RepID=UPI001C477B00|nr:Fic family protein [Chitinophaga sp. sic0106]MBV7532925.1 Fic family protein [Chitinophaga sp. sic0106]
MDSRKAIILEYLHNHPSSSSMEIHEGIASDAAYVTTKRTLSKLQEQGLVESTGQKRSTRYRLSTSYDILRPIDLAKYFEKEIDERTIKEQFNLELIASVLTNISLFTEDENVYLSSLQQKFRDNLSHLSTVEYNKELERLAIDLSWKSSQIEGNTYSLLETERLLKEKETAAGKSLEDAYMLLNHKEALNFIIDNPEYVVPLTVSRIEDIHSILVKNLGVDRNIRQRRVGISGTNYKPLDNEHQIRDALRDMCDLINSKDNVFEKAFLALVLLSYIQAFADGNKRTARIISNALLIASGYCPISFRTVDSLDYKKAMLVFYELNNITPFKAIFINQFEFAVNNYF